MDVGHELDLGPQQRSGLADLAAQVNTLQSATLLTGAQAVTGGQISHQFTPKLNNRFIAFPTEHILDIIADVQRV